MPLMLMEHDVDPKTELLKKIGDIKDVQVFNNRVLVAIYVRPERTKGGIILSDPHGVYFRDVNVSVGDWVYFRPSHGQPLTINDREGLCRLFADTDIAGIIPNPDMIW